MIIIIIAIVVVVVVVVLVIVIISKFKSIIVFVTVPTLVPIIFGTLMYFICYILDSKVNQCFIFVKRLRFLLLMKTLKKIF